MQVSLELIQNKLIIHNHLVLKPGIWAQPVAHSRSSLEFMWYDHICNMISSNTHDPKNSKINALKRVIQCFIKWCMHGVVHSPDLESIEHSGLDIHVSKNVPAIQERGILVATLVPYYDRQVVFSAFLQSKWGLEDSILRRNEWIKRAPPWFLPTPYVTRQNAISP